MMVPTVSIITVCKNAAATIGMTIDGILSQKTAEVEYIIVDGASNDGTQEIVRSYGDSIDVFVSEPDSGIADAFNKGISLANGRITGLINADDVILPGAVQKVCDYFMAHPEAEVLHGDVMLFAGNRPIKRVKPAGRWWYPWRLVLFNHPATFVRRDVYVKCGLFDTSYLIAMDVEIFLRWMRKEIHIAYVPDIMVAMQAGGVSNRRAFHGYREVRRALLSHRFPSIPTTFQYLARFGVQFTIYMHEKLRSVKRLA